MSGAILGVIALGGSLCTGFVWFRRVQAVDVPENRAGFVVAMLVGLVLGVWALSLGAGAIGGTAAVLAILAGVLFNLTVLIGGQKGGTGALRVGEPMPDFTAPDENGESFQLSSLKGKPILLKFFRGHW